MEVNSLSEGWTEDLIKEYRELPVPTLYEFAVSGEKFSAELRKQNKEIKAMGETVERLVNIVSKPKEELRRLETPTETQCQKVLMEAFDAVFLLRDQMEKSMKNLPQVKNLKKEQFRKKQLEQVERVESILGSFSHGIHLVQDKFLSLLADLGIEPFCPKSGDQFSAREQRAVLKLKEGVPGTINKTVRVGYRASQNVLRFADVIINY